MANNPKHPYTWGLMSSAPILDPTLRDREKQLLSGDPGSLIKIGTGCRFCPETAGTTGQIYTVCGTLTGCPPAGKRTGRTLS